MAAAAFSLLLNRYIHSFFHREHTHSLENSLEMEEQELCTEFAKNFSALEVKFSTLQQQYRAQLDRCAQQDKQISLLGAELDRRDVELKRCMKDVDEANSLRERFHQANVAIEHLKGRMESSRQALVDKDAEHRQELEQLQSQLRDALSRIDLNTDAPMANALKGQKAELEERCALLNAQLLDISERHNHELLLSAHALRDAQARLTEAEQRCRSLDAEVTKLRAACKRQTDVATEAVMERDRLLVDHRSLVGQLEASRRNAQAEAFQHEERLANAATALESQRGLWDAEREGLIQRINEAGERLQEVAQLRSVDQERFAAAQRQVQGKVDQARAEYESDLEAAVKAKHLASDESHRLRAKTQELTAELARANVAKGTLERKVTGLEAAVHGMQSRLDAAVQGEAWAMQERVRLDQVVAGLTQRVDELSSAELRCHQLDAEARKSAMQLEFSRSETNEAIRLKEMADASVQKMTALRDADFKAFRRELKTMHKVHRRATEKQDQQKRVLLLALADRSADEEVHHGVATTTANVNNNSDLPHCGGVSVDADPLMLLRAQNHAAGLFRDSVLALQRGRH